MTPSANSRHGAGMINVSAQVAAGIDSREDPIGFRREMMKREARHAVDRGTPHGDVVRARPREVDPAMRRRAVSAAGVWLLGRDDEAVAQAKSGVAQCFQAGRVPAVVVGQQNRRHLLGRERRIVGL